MTRLFFQVVVDKVPAHRSYSTLTVLVIGLIVTASSTSYCNICGPIHFRTRQSIDVELGRRLFRHRLHLPLSYFETRAAGPDGSPHA
ncbi:ABC transporter transmembrane domain-containing protein [Rhizobium giardinii]|uniref:ABC transporter transmembrane domain-containing protein n=1 Tax=Rhizobium giardinii TaxID=56731 RepID=UPI0039DF9A56